MSNIGWQIFLTSLGIVAILILIFGFPRKKSERTPSKEGIDDPGVAKAFELMTKLPPFKIIYSKFVKKLKTLNPDGKLVDIGCGSGNLIVKIAKHLSELELVGVDISEEMLEKAKNRAIEKGFEKKIEFKIGSAEKIPFLDNTIDVIVSTFSLHHWLDPKKVLLEIQRVLKPGGRFLIFDFRRDARKFYYGFFKFVTKVIVPKPLKKMKEPLASIKAAYTPNEVIELNIKILFQEAKVRPSLLFMYVVGNKG